MIDMTDLSLMGIEKNWQDWESKQFTFNRIDEKRIEISTTILDAFSNSISFYLDENAGIFSLTDLGSTFDEIQENTSFSVDPTPIIQKTAQKYGIEFNNSILKIDNISINNLAPAIRDFAFLIRDAILLSVN